MIGDGEISGFVGFDIYIYIYFFFLLVFLVLLRMGFLVFDFFCGFGCDCGLWLKWQFGGDLLAVVVVAVGCGLCW